MAVEVRQLEYFVAVAEERHFTRAAQRMHVAQSGLSASIRSLERELGAALFVRNTRRVELTDAGRALLVEARHTLTTLAAAKDAVAAVQGLLRGSLSVGTLQCVGAVDLLPVLARFHAAHPGVEIQLRQGSSTELIDRVRAGDLDLALVGVPPAGAPGVALAPLSEEELVLACGPDHPLAHRTGVRLDELRGETFADFCPGWCTRDTTDQVLAAAQVPRRVGLEVNDVHSLLDLVGHGMGIALVPHSFTCKKTSARFVRLADPAPVWRTAIATAVGQRLGAAARTLLAADEFGPAVRAVPAAAPLAVTAR
jgi:DNA-binding transcriptional LysR family regulator